MTGFGWALQVAQPGVGEPSPRPIPQQEGSLHSKWVGAGEGKTDGPTLSKRPSPPLLRVLAFWDGVGWGGSSVSQAPLECSGLDKGLQDHTQPLIEVSILGSRGEPLSETQDTLRALKG